MPTEKFALVLHIVRYENLVAIPVENVFDVLLFKPQYNISLFENNCIGLVLWDFPKNKFGIYQLQVIIIKFTHKKMLVINPLWKKNK